MNVYYVIGLRRQNITLLDALTLASGRLVVSTYIYILSREEKKELGVGVWT
jgi:hypothetical protein